MRVTDPFEYLMEAMSSIKKETEIDNQLSESTALKPTGSSLAGRSLQSKKHNVEIIKS